MSPQAPAQQNDYCGEINDIGGTFIAGRVFNSGGGDFFFGSQPVDAAHLREGKGICVLSCSMCTHICMKK